MVNPHLLTQHQVIPTKWRSYRDHTTPYVLGLRAVLLLQKYLNLYSHAENSDTSKLRHIGDSAGVRVSIPQTIGSVQIRTQKRWL